MYLTKSTKGANVFRFFCNPLIFDHIIEPYFAWTHASIINALNILNSFLETWRNTRWKLYSWRHFIHQLPYLALPHPHCLTHLVIFNTLNNLLLDLTISWWRYLYILTFHLFNILPRKFAFSGAELHRSFQTDIPQSQPLWNKCHYLANRILPLLPNLAHLLFIQFHR